MRKSVVLLVDGDTPHRDHLSTRLWAEGYEVMQAPEVAVAVRMVRERRPDIVVHDPDPADPDSAEMLGRLVGADPSLPIIVYATHLGYQDSFLSWLAEEHLRKSSDPAMLLEALRRRLVGPGGEVAPKEN